jgi:site-specific recombinase XerD
MTMRVIDLREDPRTPIDCCAAASGKVPFSDASETTMTHVDGAAASLLAPAGDVLSALLNAALAYAADANAASTQKAYKRDAEAFARWCTAKGLASLPADPATVGVYLAHLADAGRKVTTIERALAAIAVWQRSHGHAWPKGHPAVRDVMRGIRRRVGVAPTCKAPIVGNELARMVAVLGVDLAGTRDRALLTLGWFGAFRRSELVALDVGDVRFVSEGAILTLRRSKTDQEGRGAEKGIPFATSVAACPVRALRAWLDAARLTDGPLFRAVDRFGRVSGKRMADRTVARIVQRVAQVAGISTDVAGHSLRAGFATTAAAGGKDLDAIMRQTGHRSERVARGYIRHGTLFTANAAMGLL